MFVGYYMVIKLVNHYITCYTHAVRDQVADFQIHLLKPRSGPV
jgi:hypothetical protein